MLFIASVRRHWHYGKVDTTDSETEFELTEQSFGMILFVFSAAGVIGYFQGASYANIMYWRALLVFVGIHFVLICTIYREASDPVSIDLPKYLRVLVRAILVAGAAYLLLEIFDVEVVIPSPASEIK